jgi:hypothetical protein
VSAARVKFTQIVEKFLQLVRRRHTDIRYLPRKANESVLNSQFVCCYRLWLFLVFSIITPSFSNTNQTKRAIGPLLNVKFYMCNNDGPHCGSMTIVPIKTLTSPPYMRPNIEQTTVWNTKHSRILAM